MPVYNLSVQTVTNGGGTVTFPVANIPDFIRLNPSGGSVTLAANYTLTTSAHPPVGISFIVSWDTLIDLNGNSVSIFGIPLVQWQLNSAGYLKFTSINGTDYAYEYNPYDISQSSLVDGDFIISQTVSLDKLEPGTSAQLIVCNVSGAPVYKTLSGDATITTGGALTIANGAITDAKVDAAAAIDRSKLATGTASQVVVNDGSGVMTSVAEVPPVNGGTGQDTSASTGFATVSAGTWSVGAISEVITVPVSWESGEQCNNRVKIPFAGTVTNIYAVVTKALSGTDAGTIVPKNAASTNMTLASALSFAASSALETAIDTNVSANNTVAAGDIIYLTTAKTTVGGKALVSITITRES